MKPVIVHGYGPVELMISPASKQKIESRRRSLDRSKIKIVPCSIIFVHSSYSLRSIGIEGTNLIHSKSIALKRVSR